MATVAFQDSYTQANPGLGRLPRIVQKPLLIGLVAAGGAGIYAWSSLTGPSSGLDEFAPVKLPAAPQTTQAPAKIPEVEFLAAPVAAASPIEAAIASRASLAAAVPVPAYRPARQVPAAAVAPAAPRAPRPPAPDYSYVNRVVLAAPPPAPELPARTVRVEMPPPAPAALAPQSRRVTGSFAAPSLQPLDMPGVEPSAAQLVPAQPLMSSLQAVAPGTAPAAPLQLAPAQPALTVEPPGEQAAPLITPPAVAAPMGASRSTLSNEPQSAPQLAPSAPTEQPLQTPPGAVATDAATLSAAGFHKLDDAQLSGIKSITGQGKQSGRAAVQTEPARSAAPVASPAKQGESAQAKLPEKVIGSAIDLRVPVVSGAAKGELQVRIGANGKAAVRLGELLSLFGDRMDSNALTAFNSSSVADAFVGFEALRAAGIDIGYDHASNEVRLSASNA